MRQGQNHNKNRGRGPRRKQGNNINRALDSSGPDVRIRGTAMQINEKYLGLARDAQTSGDHVKAENYFQHAEHYFRIMKSLQPQQQQQERPAPQEGAVETDAQPAAQPDGETPSAEQPSAAPVVENGAADNAPPADSEASAEEETPRPRRRRRAVRKPAEDAQEAASDAVAEEAPAPEARAAAS